MGKLFRLWQVERKREAGCQGVMQNPSDAIVQYSRASSVSTLWTRLNARRHVQGLPMLLPVARGAVVRMAAEADMVGDVKLTIWNAKWFWHDNIIFFCFALPAGWVWLMNRVPK